MSKSEPQGDVGVIIGRFQVDDLHEGHMSLIDSVLDRHDRVVILLGSMRGIKASRRNPLDYQTRVSMISDYLSEPFRVTFHPLYDAPSDQDWSDDIDSILEGLYPESSFTLYGSRDSFIPHYRGNFECLELRSSSTISGSEIRKKITKTIRSDSVFRTGVIHGVLSRPLVSYQTVDVAILDGDDAVLLGRKAGEESWRLPGGFVSPSDESLEHAASREAHEECGALGLSRPRYVGSARIKDWRYENDDDKILTSLFVCDYSFGAPEASDDLEDVRWFKKNELLDVVVDEHKVLIEMLMKVYFKEPINA